ncbi:D-Ala-D-Ala carboxypeptidase family metallohydrolase [Aureimonas sp. ME7]|uniref:YcbK family protein n=1 Tax=Aureimonas sp. ME7 TaxID=2744252 RepID=UPI0015F3BB52|nr:D-Ala-D-Ala carboxypeptidase family metallohydrolase [Aureimonas sp. ME7]
MTLLPIIGGCVSAVDETTAFGFANKPEPATVEDAIAADPTRDAPSDVAASKASPSNAKPADPARELASVAASPEAEEVAATEASDGAAERTASADGGIKAGSFLTPTAGAAVAAYAPGKKGKEADQSLYASLFTQSEAKTPLRNAEKGKSERVIVHQRSDQASDPTANALPGVDPKSLFEIGQRASVDSELMDDIGSSYQLASLSGIARLAPSGLMIQRDDVVTNCFDTNLMNLISQIERRFKQRVVITSGFRSPAHNRRVNGAKASMHMACKAADLHVPGVNGQEVARFVRALPGRGGVGTYCHTAAIHIDVGAQRDWNWPCRRRQST